jgi:carbon-monoxide dehydrogenase medium subunit
MRDFTFLEARTVAEASALLVEHGDAARPLAGGTALVLLMRHRLVSPTHIVYLGGIPGLDRIVAGEDGLHIGALATHAAIEAHPDVRARYPVLAEMARVVANPQIRNVATIGGNLCHGDPASDPPACLLALGARVRAVRDGKEREIPLEEFFTDLYENALGPGEIAREIVVPPLPAGARTAYMRFVTSAAESRPLVVVGVRLTIGADGACNEARVVLGAVCPVPRRLLTAEERLRGQRLTPDVLAEVAALAVADLEPVSDFRGTAEYRREIARVMVRRVLERAVRPGT